MIHPNPPFQLIAACCLIALLTACGGGGGGSGGGGLNGDTNNGMINNSGSASALPIPTTPPTTISASRFLAQATYGATSSDIDRVVALGWKPWLDEQFSAPTLDNDTHTAYYKRKGPVGCNPCDRAFINAVMESFWRQAVLGPDQLRQRSVFALSQIFVVSTVNIDAVDEAYSEYLDMLSRHAFGNFRTLLEEVSLHPTMGRYLSHLQNEKEDPATGRIPDQNYAREVMQLFSIGLWQLNADGSRKKDSAGQDIPTYGQAEIAGMSRVFTGWSWAGQANTAGNWQYGHKDFYSARMQNYPDFHSSSAKPIINSVVIPANTNGPESLRIALDTLFNHPNVGPFIGSQLIKRLVTSNPSPAYIARVTRAFNDNGSGVRGDMKAVLQAILLDPEARDMAKINSSDWGKLREPVLRYGHFLRSFGVTSDSGVYPIWNLESGSGSIGQNPLRAPSVFNWYRFDYSPPGNIFKAGLVAPEFQITHETTTSGYTNFIRDRAERETERFKSAASRNRNDLFTNYAKERALANNPAALMDHLNVLLMAGQMRPALRNRIITALNALPLNNETDQYNRVSTAVTLIMASPQYLIQK